MTDQNIAIAHKDYDVYGGGEVLAEELARTFDAPLYVGHKDKSNMPDSLDVDVHEIAPDSRWHRLMDWGGAPRGLGHMMHWRDHGDDALAGYDTVITSGNEPLWWTSRDDQTVVAYTHSTPRWMYDLYHDMDGFIGRTYNQAQRRLYEGRAKDPDLYVANSDLVARRIQKYWAVPEDKIQVVYPPVPTHEYSPGLRETGGYYLYLGRLAGHKRVGDVIEAFNRRDSTNLKIAGKGPERNRLERMAGENIHFKGFVSEDEKRRLYAGARALIYPAQNEDFGMVPIESMAAGTPVIGVDEGFTQYQIQDGLNGYTFDRNAPSIYDAIQSFERNGVAWADQRIAEFADRFSVEQFHEGMRDAVRDARERASVTPDWMDNADSDTPTAEKAGATGQPARPDGGEIWE